MANHLNACYALIIGDDEISTGKVQIKNLKTRETTSIAVDHLLSEIQRLHTLGL
jgi:histidyl-tRNA synthetase